jgi:O-acetyl-ADP-ribose deacetylase (regulator of RNase III)
MTATHEIELLAVEGDITRYPSDVIVNAANESLLGGGGVDGAIHRAAGPELLEACRRLHGAKTGESKMTDAFGITTARKIVHTVGPVYARYRPERAAELLAECYRTSLDLASEYDSIAFPAISTGVYGYPAPDAARVAVGAIRDWIARHPTTALRRISLIAFSPPGLDALRTAIDEPHPTSGGTSDG